jgi:hypothetical protein
MSWIQKLLNPMNHSHFHAWVLTKWVGIWHVWHRLPPHLLILLTNLRKYPSKMGNSNGLMSVEELGLKYQITNACMFYNSLLSCLPRFWKPLKHFQCIIKSTVIWQNVNKFPVYFFNIQQIFLFILRIYWSFCIFSQKYVIKRFTILLGSCFLFITYINVYCTTLLIHDIVKRKKKNSFAWSNCIHL